MSAISRPIRPATVRSRSMGLPRYQVNIAYAPLSGASHRHRTAFFEVDTRRGMPVMDASSSSVIDPHSPTKSSSVLLPPRMSDRAASAAVPAPAAVPVLHTVGKPTDPIDSMRPDSIVLRHISHISHSVT